MTDEPGDGRHEQPRHWGEERTMARVITVADPIIADETVIQAPGVSRWHVTHCGNDLGTLKRGDAVRCPDCRTEITIKAIKAP